jgi:signal transduction histidine kinase
VIRMPKVLRTWRGRVATGLSVLAIIALICLASLRQQPRLPYRDSFSSNRAREWQAYGGVWQLSDGTLFNRSDERGAKIVTGSSRWSDYRFQSDLEMLGHEGDVGVIVRVGDEEQGSDSYNGYYIGLRSLDAALVIGRADHGWLEGRPLPMPGGVHASTWYRLTVVAVGCRIGAAAVNLSTGQTAWGAFEEDACVRSGKIGLRSMATGGAWRNITVTPATSRDLVTIWQQAGSVLHPVYPGREAGYSRIRLSDFAQNYVPARIDELTSDRLSGQAKSTKPELLPPLTSVESMRTMASRAEVRVRGVVTLTHPLYIQDSTGGIAVNLQRTIPLNLGDEIEAIGTLINSPYEPRLDATHIRLLWDRTLAVPLSISSTQAAGGGFNSSLVEIRGYLRAKHRDANGTVTLHLEDESQAFTAILRNSLATRAFASWEPGSWLRVHGICVIGEPPLSSGSAFTIVARAPEDIEVLAGPPWWSGYRIVRLIVPFLLLLVFSLFIYLRIERWKMNAILSERERLAHEMHDTLAQSFAGVGFHLQGMRNTIRSGAPAGRADLMQKLDLACDIVAQTHREASASIAALHPEADGGRDLLVALERYAARMLSADAFPMLLERNGTAHELSLPVRDALFQIGREAITNVIRHSGADHVILSLTWESRSALLRIQDNGSGFLPDEGSGFGIEAMRRRSQAVGARLEIASRPGDGTTVTVRAPFGHRLTVADWFRHILRVSRRRGERIHADA